MNENLYNIHNRNNEDNDQKLSDSTFSKSKDAYIRIGKKKELKLELINKISVQKNGINAIPESINELDVCLNAQRNNSKIKKYVYFKTEDKNKLDFVVLKADDVFNKLKMTRKEFDSY